MLTSLQAGYSKASGLSRMFSISMVIGALQVATDVPRAAGGGFTLEGTVWNKVAIEQDIAPLLLYSVSLMESRFSADQQLVSPTPYAIRTPDGSRYFENKNEAKEYFKASIETYQPWEIDVCAMQINLRWNGSRVANWEELLDLETCLKVGTLVLKEALASAPNDIELGIGRYHHWDDEKVSRKYGRDVLSVMKALETYSARK